ncbi:uncharacterized protein LOC103146819 [Poecilia formosa]|uniref:uncharacterized protein LOC103146818 n=1 Tax=Poecilia formosa TaxID=48698 RepID=UPI0007B85732|nr:PREDICTED: uncharacterized protein LOC103146818 [Poecilia formosa]XP_016533344.1 PREDICTED: uncharacterized protein LOC103146819 [Poecilia formosa]
MKRKSDFFRLKQQFSPILFSVSLVLPDANETKDGNATLQCSPWKKQINVPCSERNIRWLDAAGAELQGEAVHFQHCASNLTVNLQDDRDKILTCQIFFFNKVRTEANYPPVPKDTRGGSVHFQFSKSGADVALSCKRDLVSFDCSAVRWLHYRGSTKPTLEIENGKVVQRSGRAARLSVDSQCSLIITNITAEDAGKYTCQLQGGAGFDTDVYLFILTMSPPPPDADVAKGRNVTVQCSLAGHSSSDHCPQNIIRWVDDTGSELTGEDAGHKDGKHKTCASSLTVKLQRGIKTRYHCLVVVQTKVRVVAEYTAFLPEASPSDLIMSDVTNPSLRAAWMAAPRNKQTHTVQGDVTSSVLTGSTPEMRYQTSVVTKGSDRLTGPVTTEGKALQALSGLLAFYI